MSCYGENCIPPGVKTLQLVSPILQPILFIAIIIAIIGGIIIIIKKKIEKRRRS